MSYIASLRKWQAEVTQRTVIRRRLAEADVRKRQTVPAQREFAIVTLVPTAPPSNEGGAPPGHSTH